MRGTTRSEPGFDACSSAVIHACTNMSSGRCASSFAIDQFLGNRILSVVVLLRLERWNVCLHVDSSRPRLSGENDSKSKYIRIRSHRLPTAGTWLRRSEEHTSELQSLMRIPYPVFVLK